MPTPLPEGVSSVCTQCPAPSSCSFLSASTAIQKGRCALKYLSTNHSTPKTHKNNHLKLILRHCPVFVPGSPLQPGSPLLIPWQQGHGAVGPALPESRTHNTQEVEMDEKIYHTRLRELRKERRRDQDAN